MTIEYAGKEFPVAKVVDELSKVITPERWQKINEVIRQRDGELAVVLENIYDRGNASAVMRSMEAFGFYKLHHIELQQEFKKSQRVTQGADKWLLQKRWQNTAECIRSLKSQGYKIYVTHLDNAKSIENVSFDRPVALCFGNEKDGASRELCEMADERILIPMYGFVQSFNISVAAALCLQTIRKRHESGVIKPLSAEEVTYLQARYLLKSCKNPLNYLCDGVKDL